ncbi:Polysaccharide biosynthesis protein [Moorella glycerini]|uniref:Colanic acid exporter n=1 Tax=Neomoorella stamsii TaxID=1266720 RepID=A0A9X7J5M2_9FIRM|nr:oligosaccharide flippase family protein [Moorella stamsii]PRR77051.1 colanic acid exporter [Moorella stamsii]CEP68826.1 Polysaccharide biosynthesis protein [Moorella glycerini]
MREVYSRLASRQFVRDVGALTAAQFAGAVLNFIQGILVARWLGPDLYGLAGLVMSYPGLVYTFFDARSSEASVKYLSEFSATGERDRVLAVCKLGYTVDFAIAALAFVVVLATVPWAAERVAHRPEVAWFIVVYAMAFIPRAFVGTSHAVLTTKGRFSTIAWIDLAVNVLRVVIILALVLAGWQVKGVVWGNAAAMIATGVLYGTAARRTLRYTWGMSWWRGSWQALRGRRREVLSFLAYSDLNALVGMIPKQLDLVLLGYFRGPTEVGYYRLAKSLSGAVGYLVGPLQSVIYPELAKRHAAGNSEELRSRTRQLATRVGLPLGTMVILGAALSPLILPPLVGTIFLPSVPILQIFSIGMATWLYLFWLRPFYLAQGWIKTWVKGMVLVSLACLALWPAVTPLFGAVGTAAVWSITMSVGYLGLYLGSVRRPSR